MAQVESEVDRYLTLLRNLIRQRGFTQLQVQKTLGWGRSYISQLMMREKAVRVEQGLKILEVIGVDPAEFYAELYGKRGAPNAASMDRGEAQELQVRMKAMEAMLDGMVGLLLEKRIITYSELRAAGAVADREA